MIRLFSSLPPWGRLLILAGFCLYFASFAEGRYRGKSLITDDKYKYAPSLPPMAVATVFAVYLILDLWSWRGVNGLTQFGLFVLRHAFFVALFSTILYLVIKPLRKRYNAASCSMLWIVINYLYFYMFTMAATGLYEPLIKLTVPKNAFTYITLAYLLIAAAVFIKGCAEHLAFRNRVLSAAVPVDNEEITGRLAQIATDLSGRSLSYDILVSDEISSPLSIGVFDKTAYIVLPRTDYSYDEMDLILRHEVIHLLRNDPQTKMFMLFCRSLLWWYPLMPKCSELCSQDIEFSCDEAVLYGSDEKEKHLYADLVIANASDDTGFTTCLSAKAEALRYRLKRIMEPPVDRSGRVLIAVAMAVISLAVNLVSIEVPAGKLGIILSMPQIGTEELKINYLYVDGRITGFEPEEQEKLLGMISDMDVSISERAYKYDGPRIQVDMLWNGRWARVNIERGLIYAVGDELYKGDRIFVHPYWPADENAVKAIVELVNKKDL